MVEQMSYGMKYSFSQFRSVIWALIPPRIYPPPSCWWCANIGEIGLILGQGCSAVAKILIFISTFFATNAKLSTVRAAIGKKTPSQPESKHCQVKNNSIYTGSWQEGNDDFGWFRKASRMQTLLKYNVEWIYTQPNKNTINGIELKVIFSLMCSLFSSFFFFFLFTLIDWVVQCYEQALI